MESVGKTGQCVEHDLGQVLAARNAAISNIREVPGVGPPDLCWLQRSAKGLFRKRRPRQQGYYHWVVGLNVTSVAAVAAYVARMTTTVKKVGYFPGMGVGRELQIERGIYCCYDPFTEMDIWVDIGFPGGSVSRSLDRQGCLHDVTEEMWQGAQVGAFLRSQLYDMSVTLHCSRCFQHLKPFQSHAEEEEMLTAVIELYRNEAVQPQLKKLHWDQGQGFEPVHLDVVCATILEYFKTRRRWQKALQFFTNLQNVYPSSVVYIAHVYQELDNKEGAAELVRSSLDLLRQEEHPMLLLASGYIALQNKNYNEASQVAMVVLETQPKNRPAWLLLSRTLLSQKEYSKSLRMLHLLPPPLIPVDRKTLIFRVLPSAPRFITKAIVSFHPEETELTTINSEAHKIGKMSHIAPGQILAPRYHLHGSDWGLFSCTQSVMRAVYDILLDIVHLMGWEEFCKLRSSIFLIPDDEESNSLEAEIEGNLIFIEWTIHEGFRNQPVGLHFHYEESLPREKPRRKPEALYVKTISSPVKDRVATEKEKKDTESEIESQLATKVITRGLSQVTKKALKIPKLLRSRSKGEREMMSSLKSPIETSPEFSVEESRLSGSITEMDPMVQSPVPESSESSFTRTNKDLGRSTSRRKRVEVVTSTILEPFPNADDVPDAPDNVLPKQWSTYPVDRRLGPPSSSGFSQDKWQVKMVSMGIQNRVKYFEQVAKEKFEKQGRLPPDVTFDEETCVSMMKPRQSKRKVKQTIMEVLIQEIPEMEQSLSLDEAPLEEEMITETDQESNGESPEPVSLSLSQKEKSTDWGTFALQNAAFLPQIVIGMDSERMESGLWDATADINAGHVVVGGDNGPAKAKIEEIWKNDNPCECAAWLEELILALWEDLAIFMEFKSLDRKLKARNMQTHAEQILGTIEWNTDTTEEDENTPKAQIVIPESRPVDWMRRALLCLRLRRMAEAEQSFRVCSFLSFNLTSLLALSKIYSDWGYCKGAMLLLNRIARFHHKKHDSRKERYLSMALVKNISLLMEAVGNKDVKAAAERSHPLVLLALDDVLAWKLQSSRLE